MEIPPSVGNVRLTLQLVNGKQHELVPSNPAMVLQTLQQMRSDRVFSQKHLILAGKDTTTVVATESIERIEVRAEPLPDWPHREDIANVAEITADRFYEMQHYERVETPRVMGRPMLAPVPEIGIQVEMRSGKEYHLLVHFARPTEEDRSVARTADDIRLSLQHLFTWPVILGRLLDTEGLFLLNPANALRFTLTPPPPEPVAAAWALDIVPNDRGEQYSELSGNGRSPGILANDGIAALYGSLKL